MRLHLNPQHSLLVHPPGLSPGGHRFVDRLDNAVLRRLSTDAPAVPITTLVFDIDNTLYDETSGLGENAWRVVYEYMVEKLHFPTIGFAKTVCLCVRYARLLLALFMLDLVLSAAYCRSDWSRWCICSPILFDSPLPVGW